MSTDKHPTLYVVIETVPDAKPVVWHAFDSAENATEYLAAPPGIEHGKVVQYVPVAALSSVTAERDALRAEITHIRDTSAAALLTALEAAERRVAAVRAETVEEAARVADAKAALWMKEQNRHLGAAVGGDKAHWPGVVAGAAAQVASDIRALASKPPAEDPDPLRIALMRVGDLVGVPNARTQHDADEVFARVFDLTKRPQPAEPRAAEAPLLSSVRVVRHCNADNGLAVCTFEHGHDGPHSWPPPFDTRKAIPDRTTVAMHLFAALWADPDSTEEGCVTAAFRGADVFLAAAGSKP